MQSCSKVALDFVSPENIGECIRLMNEIRKLPKHHKGREDKLMVLKISPFMSLYFLIKSELEMYVFTEQIKKMVLHAMENALTDVEKLMPDSNDVNIQEPANYHPRHQKERTLKRKRKHVLEWKLLRIQER